ncbi:MAG: hypothetical protein QE274_02415 [Verrucomicrobiaceae bacterium]|nr:hypothetical protein [Verrucomicrobiaceae bacterium]
MKDFISFPLSSSAGHRSTSTTDLLSLVLASEQAEARPHVRSDRILEYSPANPPRLCNPIAFEGKSIYLNPSPILTHIPPRFPPAGGSTLAPSLSHTSCGPPKCAVFAPLLSTPVTD